MLDEFEDVKVGGMGDGVAPVRLLPCFLVCVIDTDEDREE